MAVHPFQISDLNYNFLGNSPTSTNMGSYASEFAVMPDNVNANCSRYMKLQGVWSNINIGAVSATVNNDSYGQSTGIGNANSYSYPARPNGGYFVRGLYFTNTAIPSNDSTGAFRVGYVGSFVGGLLDCDYAHDPNTLSVDYEPVYSHAAAVWPMTASAAKQWRDPQNPPLDGTDLISNSSSSLSRTAYMPPSYMLLHIDSAGSNTLSSGDVQFHLENRPTLHMAGFNDQLGVTNVVPNWTGASIWGGGVPYAYPADPLTSGNLSLASSTLNYHEYYLVSGVRKLNSRGLSFHIAKVFDNGAYAYAYPYEEDGITLGTNVSLSSSNIQSPFTYVNDQQEYVWAGGRDQGTSVTATSVASDVVTFTTTPVPTPYASGTVVLIQGLTAHPELNGALLTVLSGATATSFTANWTHATYATAEETEGGVAVASPDFRVRQAATFIVNEEYYGTVADTKCAIWSNKASMVPLLFFDLADTWTASVAKRIAGVAVVPLYSGGAQAWQVFFLSEDGYLAVYDFTQTNGAISLLSPSPGTLPAPATGEAYGALRARSTTSDVTAVQVTSDVVTVTCSNTFEVGEIVNVQGLGNATFLNDQTLTVTGLVGGGPTYTGFTAAFTNANYGPTSETQGTAVGYALWALYGTMSPDPRLTQTAIPNTARIGVVRYLTGGNTWGSIQYSTLGGRHNGRSLNEMISARDSKLYMLVEDVTVTGTYNVSNSFGAVTNVNWQVMAADPTNPSAVVWNGTKVNGSTLLQYGTNMGPNGVTFLETSHFWFYNINASLYDIGTGSVLIQPNWTAGANLGTTGGTQVGLQVLNVTGSTASLSNTQLTAIERQTIFPDDSFVGVSVFPEDSPVSVVHARDYATGADRAGFWLHDLVRSNNTIFPLYLAPPSYDWAAALPAALTLIQRNSYGGSPLDIQSFQKDYWSWSYMQPIAGAVEVRNAWVYPTMLTDNYMHYVTPCAGIDGLPTSSIYGRSAAQGMAFLPTYWKWTGSAWAMADSFEDAAANPYAVPNANVNVPLPYGLQATFGPAGTTSYTFGEFHTWNMCWGNTKFARKLRQSYAQFAGQTFTNTDTRTVASENALGMFLIDTDLGSVSLTAPTSATPQTATLANPSLGWTTQVTWPKLDTVNAPFDATPLVMVWNPSNLSTSSLTNPPCTSYLVSGSSPGPYTWTVGSVTYAVTANNDALYPAWNAVDGNPQNFWQTQSGYVPATLTLDLGSGNAQTVLSYSFRPLWTSTDALDLSAPKTWTLQGSNTGAFAGEQVTVDTQANVTSYGRGWAANCNGATGLFRYYRMAVSAVQTGGSACSVGMLQLSTAVLQTTVNFSELAFYAYGSQVSPTHYYSFIRDWQMARGIMLETSTTAYPGPYTYTTVFAPGGTEPLWRSLNGYVFSFARQTGITSVRVTVQHGFNYTQTATAGFGPFYLIDYGDNGGASGSTGQNLITGAAGARLGNYLGSPAEPTTATYDPNCLGIATDVPNISIDSGNPSLLTAANTLVDTAVHGFWDFNPVPSAGFKMHPFFGFIFFQGAGPNNAYSNQTGTSAAISYQWGRRV